MNVSFGAATACVTVLMSLMVGCAPTQAERMDASGPVRARAGVAAPPDADLPRRDVRVDSIQRFDGDDGKAVSGIVTVRNIADTPRTVRVSVSWINAAGEPVGPEAVSTQSATLAPGESRELRFDGATGSRDFKVAVGAVPN
jgi:hypothetical protein